MNRRRTAALLLATAASLAGCATSGRAAREDLGLPALRSTVGAVASDVQYGLDRELGPATQDQLEGLVSGVESGELTAAALDWPDLRETAELGLDERELGPSTRGIFTDRLEQFGSVLYRVAGGAGR